MYRLCLHINCSMAGRFPEMFRWCSIEQGLQVVPGGARQCQAVPSGARRCLAVPGGARQCQAVPSDARRCQAVPGGAKRCQAVPGGARRCQAVPGSARRCQAVPGNKLLKCNVLSSPNEWTLCYIKNLLKSITCAIFKGYF